MKTTATNNSNENMNSMSNETTGLPEVKVSAGTAKYFSLLDDLNGLWNNIYTTLEDEHGQDANGMFEQDFRPSLQKVHDELLDYITDRIKERTLENGRTIEI